MKDKGTEVDCKIFLISWILFHQKIVISGVRSFRPAFFVYDLWDCALERLVPAPFSSFSSSIAGLQTRLLWIFFSLSGATHALIYLQLPFCSASKRPKFHSHSTIFFIFYFFSILLSQFLYPLFNLPSNLFSP